uniref:Uncharacterized protein n=1 Tax=Arundo donax TaxID=35708 RepID=A0A0A8Y4D3_ARUDO
MCPYLYYTSDTNHKSC